MGKKREGKKEKKKTLWKEGEKKALQGKAEHFAAVQREWGTVPPAGEVDE